MPYKVEKLPPNWNDINNECQHNQLNCLWTISPENETLTVVIKCLKWTFSYAFCIRVTTHPEKTPNNSKKLDNNQHYNIFASLSEAPNDYKDFPETHLKSHQFHILGELLDSLF